MQLEHAVDQVLHRAALLREGGEVTQVPLAGREVFWSVRRPHALVTGNDGLRVQGGDRVDAGDPGLALRLICLVHHHVHVVVDHITADNGGGRWHVEDRRTLNVTLANVDQVDDLTVHRDLVSVQHLGHHGRLGEFARKARRPILARLVELRLPSSPSCNLRSRVPTSLGEVLEKAREAEPVVRVAMGDVNTRDLLAEVLRPGGDLVRVLEGQQGVDENPFGRPGDQRAAGRRPGRDFTLAELIGTDVRPHRGDVDVNRKRTGAHVSVSKGSAHEMMWPCLLAPSAWPQPPAPLAFCSWAICARAASTSSALVLACPARPHPPSIASERSTQVLAVTGGSPAAAATRSVNLRTTASCFSRLSAPALVRTCTLT